MPWWKTSKNNERTSTENLNSTSMFLKDNFSKLLEEFSPKNYEEVESIANALVLQKSVKLNLKNTVTSDRRRIIDFLCGIAFVLNFNITKTAPDIYEFKFNK